MSENDAIPEPNPAEITARAVAAALALAAEKPWAELSLAEIAARADLGLVQLYRVIPSKPAILRAFSRQIDALVLSGAVDAADPPRDRLFDVLMRRFDALTPYRPALRRWQQDLPRGGIGLLPGAAQLPKSLAWMLEAAGIETEGLRGAIRVKALTLVYLASLRSFLKDESPDLAATMASLNRGLQRGWPVLQAGSLLCRPRAAV